MALTALLLLAGDLVELLREESSKQAGLADRIAQGLRRTLHEVRVLSQAPPGANPG